MKMRIALLAVAFFVTTAAHAVVDQEKLNSSSLPDHSKTVTKGSSGQTFADAVNGAYQPKANTCIPQQGAQNFNSALGLGLGGIQY